MGMQSFLTKFKPKDAPKASSFSSYEDPAEEHKADIEAFVRKFGNVTEQYSFTFKNDDGTLEEVKIRFDKEIHTYYRIALDVETGKAYEVKIHGITSVVGIKDKSQALMPWAANETADYVKSAWLDLEPEHIAQVLADPLIMQEWLFVTLDEAKKNYREKSKAATDIGHAAHDWLEKHVNALIANDSPRVVELALERHKLPEKAISCCEAALAWMRAHNVRWMHTERKVYSRKHDAAGTCDGVCLVDSCTDPDCCSSVFFDVMSVIDWKSSNYLSESYRWQVAAYMEFLIEELGLDIQHCWVIQLGKFDGAFKTWHIPYEDHTMDFKCFTDCLELTNSTESSYRILVERRAAARAARKAEREAKEAAEKAERLRIRTERKEARAESKELYKRLRKTGVAVVAAEMQRDAWLVKRMTEIGGESVSDEEGMEEAA